MHVPILAHVFEVNSRDIDNAIAVMLGILHPESEASGPAALGGDCPLLKMVIYSGFTY